MPSSSNKRRDYFDDAVHDAVSDTEHNRGDHDEKIRKAPYLSEVEVWARSDGPYTLRLGNQWVHCDELIINGAEYSSKARQASSNSGANHGTSAATKSRRPLAGRAQSYNRTRPEKQSHHTTTSAGSNSGRQDTQSQYQPQALPTPKEQAERRRTERRRQADLEAQKHPHRERHDSGIAMNNESGALVQYSSPPSTQPSQLLPKKTRPVRPGVPRRGSSRNNSYSIPVRQRDKKNVRFAPLPR